MEIGLLLSGELGLITLNELLKKNKHKISFVFTDRKSKEIVISCEKNKIPIFPGNPRQGKASDFIASQSAPDLLLSINYLFIIEPDLIKMTKSYAINIHGSLLPKYRGRTPHVWAIINNEKKTGITAHLITENCDEGDIVLQKEISIADNFTGQDLLNVFNKLYPSIAEEVIEMAGQNKIIPFKQDHVLATWYGKRTPEDGLIDWKWQKERIRNWVRALAKPYPGAFTYYKNIKIIINKIEYSELGYSNNIPDGSIIDEDNFTVKTPNGAISIVEYVADAKIPLKKGELLNGRY